MPAVQEKQRGGEELGLSAVVIFAFTYWSRAFISSKRRKKCPATTTSAIGGGEQIY
jgi:hypothetical protein